MAINIPQTTSAIRELATASVDRWTSGDLRRSRAAASPQRLERAAQAEKVADPQRQDVPADDASTDLEPSIRQLAIRKDPEIDRVVVQVLDAKTGEVVRQIPSEEWVRHLKRLHGAKGLFVDQKG